MSDPCSLESIRQRLSSEQISPAQADRAAEVIAEFLRATCKRWFPGADYDNWCQMLPEPLLDVIVQLPALSEGGRIVADHLPTAAVSSVFVDLQTFSAFVG
ncbi:hypothetical protein GR925_01655 [Streptomyces sp. HUCO-GS316]|uniref:hypothetical protein n=1 Tax=Streptomyces sp. HUCO-GS316 TaxID=2692198 RepID=UPI0013704028|nr:hypothetical protein [Streptomyces sp. HUCO-GS316]MXM62188.1 hypothetical protein [Streptomyces sp. HUCO-GS316]